MDGLNAETTQAIARLIDVVATLAPWAGGLLVISICFRVMNEKPSDLVRALGRLFRGGGGGSS
jgi:hypothetical protein